MKFEKIATEIGKLVDEKDAAYGSSFLKSEKILKILYPNGIEPNQYKDMLAITHFSVPRQNGTADSCTTQGVHSFGPNGLIKVIGIFLNILARASKF